MGLVQSAVPSPDVSAQCFQIGDSFFAEALPRQEANCDFRLIQPTAVNGRVVDGEALPDLAADRCAEQVCQRFRAMNVEVVQHQIAFGPLGMEGLSQRSLLQIRPPSGSGLDR